MVENLTLEVICLLPFLQVSWECIAINNAIFEHQAKSLILIQVIDLFISQMMLFSLIQVTMVNMNKEIKLVSKLSPDLLMKNIKRNTQEWKYGIYSRLKCKNAAKQSLNQASKYSWKAQIRHQVRVSISTFSFSVWTLCLTTNLNFG